MSSSSSSEPPRKKTGIGGSLICGSERHHSGDIMASIDATSPSSSSSCDPRTSFFLSRTGSMSNDNTPRPSNDSSAFISSTKKTSCESTISESQRKGGVRKAHSWRWRLLFLYLLLQCALDAIGRLLPCGTHALRASIGILPGVAAEQIVILISGSDYHHQADICTAATTIFKDVKKKYSFIPQMILRLLFKTTEETTCIHSLSSSHNRD